MAKKRRARGKPGVIARLAMAGMRGLQWFVSHPQPFVAVVFLAACAIGAWNALTSSDTFRIMSIQTPSDSPFEIPEGVRGQNLWTIDLQSLAALLQAQQPQYRWVRVTRVPPHTLRIDARERIPAAQVQLAQWHLVDDDGYIFKESSAKLVDDCLNANSFLPNTRTNRINAGLF